MSRFSTKYACQSQNQWAVVTGASSGIGFQYAVTLAHLGWNIVMISNEHDQLEQCARKITEEFSVQVKSLYIDLSQNEAADTVFEFCKELNVTILINNAGIFSFKQFHNTPDLTIDTFIGLHIGTFTRLCKLFGTEMARRKEGYILNMSSLAAYADMPGIAMYQATKAYIRSLSRALWHELRSENVGVTVVCPGGVDTALYGLKPELRHLGVRLGILTPTAKLTQNALKAMFQKRKQYIPGAINKVFIPIIGLIPSSLITRLKTRLSQYEK